MSVVSNNLLLGGEGYTINKSLRLRSSASANLRRVPSSSGNAQKFTLSIWKKLGSAGGYLAAANLDTLYALFSEIELTTAGVLNLRSGTLGVSYAWALSSVPVFRDPSAWYHFVIDYDTTQATAADRVKVYVNGQQIALTGSYPAQNYSTAFNTTAPQYLHTADGYLAEPILVDGQALTPSSFGQNDAVTGVWKPKKYTGTYGTNGFYLPFSDGTSTTTLGYDKSGNGNNWTTNNVSLTAGSTYDWMTDTPSNNYAVLNPLDRGLGVSSITEGNLKATYSAADSLALSSFGMTAGKHYWEITGVTVTSGTNFTVGVSPSPYASGSSRLYASNGQYYNGSAWAAYGASYTANDVIGVAFDADNQTIEFFKNGVSQGQKTSIGLSGILLFAQIYMNVSGNSAAFNFGQRPFAYTPPTGFKALNTQNLPEPSIKAGNKHFDVSLYTGNGSSGGQTITNSGAMQPDFVWLKARSAAGEHAQFDSVRGGTKYLVSNNTNAEQTGAGITFNSNGFSLAGAQYNDNAMTVAAWQWKAGGTAVSNTAGSITSQVSANTTAGFSVVTYTGTGVAGTIGHGLGVAPKMIIVKERSTSGDWDTYHSTLGAGNYVLLNTSGASAASSTKWNNTSPTSSVFSVGLDTTTNMVGVTYVAYVFSEVSGYSKIASYTGNGSSDGPFVYCNFRPAYVLVKNTTSGSGYDWEAYDNRRLGYNLTNQVLYPDLSNAEATPGAAGLDLLSNGFKVRFANGNNNPNGATMVYMAFAENPFKYSNAR